MNNDFLETYVDENRNIEEETEQVVVHLMNYPTEYITNEFLNAMSDINPSVAKSLIYDVYPDKATQLLKKYQIPWYVRRYSKRKIVSILKKMYSFRYLFPTVEYQKANEFFRKGEYDSAKKYIMLACVIGDSNAKSLYNTLSSTQKNSFHIGET